MLVGMFPLGQIKNLSTSDTNQLLSSVLSTLCTLRGHSSPHLQVPSASRYARVCSNEAKLVPLGLGERKEGQDRLAQRQHWKAEEKEIHGRGGGGRCT